MSINPKKINGNWDCGYTLDRHTIKSVPLGYNIGGHLEYDTIRTKLGELVYKFKYNGSHDLIKAISQIVCDFLCEWEEIDDVDVVIPVPPSNKSRTYQPTIDIAKEVAQFLGASFENILKKNSAEEMKSLNGHNKSLSNKISIISRIKNGNTVLLIDDLYDTGTTLRECVKIIKANNFIDKIYVLALTRTKRND